MHSALKTSNAKLSWAKWQPRQSVRLQRSPMKRQKRYTPRLGHQLIRSSPYRTVLISFLVPGETVSLPLDPRYSSAPPAHAAATPVLNLALPGLARQVKGQSYLSSVCVPSPAALASQQAVRVLPHPREGLVDLTEVHLVVPTSQ